MTALRTPASNTVAATVGLPRAVWRLACTLGMVGRGLLTCAVVFPFAGPERRMAHVGSFSRHMLQALGIRLVVEGDAARGPAMLVANHVSWLDILAIDAAQPARFVSKSDVRRWPLIGWMVACGGTLFIERERKRDAMRVVHQVAEALQHGDVVAMFPEGTTGTGHALLPFHANLLQAAVATGTPVQALALRYADATDPVSQAAAYVGEMNIVESLWLIVRARGLVAHVRRLPPLPPDGMDRRTLGERLRREVQQALGLTAD